MKTSRAVRPAPSPLHDPEVCVALAEVFSVFADPGRVRLIAALFDARELCVCDLAAATGLSQTACSHNLRLLREQRIVRQRKQGRNVYYALDGSHVRPLLDVALRHVEHQ